MSMHKYSYRARFLLLAFAIACGGPDKRVQKLSDYYTPGLKFDEPLSADVQAKYHLAKLPIPGYGDSIYVGPDGVHVLAILLHTNGDGGVASVSLGLPTRAAFQRVVARAGKELGKPTHDICIADARSAQRTLIWTTSGGKSVSITGSATAWSTEGDVDADSLPIATHSLQLNIKELNVGSMPDQPCPSRG
ncbi:MAG: hypothetical protein ABJE10_04260 [bacterium]